MEVEVSVESASNFTERKGGKPNAIEAKMEWNDEA
jgi:hypothetical protein